MDRYTPTCFAACVPALAIRSAAIPPGDFRTIFPSSSLHQTLVESPAAQCLATSEPSACLCPVAGGNGSTATGRFRRVVANETDSMRTGTECAGKRPYRHTRTAVTVASTSKPGKANAVSPTALLVARCTEIAAFCELV